MEKRMENECGEWMGEDNVEGLRRMEGSRGCRETEESGCEKMMERD